ncbi:MAG: hypothetical protein WCC18_18600 [Candidatus Acidiferrales bacterium]
MSYGPQDSRLKMTRDEEEHFNSLSFNEGIAYLHELELAQGLRVPDPMNASVLHEVEPANTPQPKKFALAITDPTTGQKDFLEADSQEKLNALQIQWYREHQSTTAQQNDLPRNSRGQFTKDPSTKKAEELTQEDAVELQRRAKLDQEFRTGLISPAEYLAATGAFDAYLTEKGIDPDVLKAQSEENRANVAEMQTWAQATEEFKNSEAGADWPGGEQNRELLQQIIFNEGWQNNPDKLETLTNAYAVFKELVARHEGAASARTRQDMDQVLGITARNTQVWGS